MSAQEPTNNQLAEETPADKGKGVAETSVEDSAMDEDDSSSSDEEETRDSRSALFEGYNDGSRRPPSAGPSGGYGYGYAGGNGNGATSSPAFGAPGGFRSATPNRKEAPWANSKLTWQQRGQYSDAVLNELESQNDAQVEGILGKVKILKDMTHAIGDEIRDSSALAEKMNDTFDSTRLRIRGTMNRMLVMAQKTGVGWKVWLAFFAAVGFLFFYVWVF
ncbi:hypothetical protein BN1708_011161 [Verticillium longisporum]|uniref:t-SNARE coiled-coil homology domain-containing protein n=1 Tax=Verticillium longisporum TaxID=100787 RepID=A0A0G4KXS3_VERLO|nr:hypothetical protein BN1708_011161 [Verticillium longisporum]